MNDPNNTNSSDTLNQTDEDILTYTASDEALELAAAGTERGVITPTLYVWSSPCGPCT